MVKGHSLVRVAFFVKKVLITMYCKACRILFNMLVLISIN